MKRPRRIMARWELAESQTEIRSVEGDWIAETCFHGIFREGHRVESPEHRAHLAVAQAIVDAHNASKEAAS